MKGNPVLYKSLVVGVIVLFIGVGVQPAFALVNTSNGYIQDLIDNASEGDTIYIPSGTYYENIVIDKSVNLVGEDKNTTIIDGSRKGEVVSIFADGVNISDFTIQNSDDDSSIIYINSDNNNIFSNYIKYGEHGIYIRNGSFNNIYNNFIENITYKGIHIYSYPEVNCMYNNVFNNTINFYIEVHIDSSGISARGINNTISGNTITDSKHDGIKINDDSNDNLVINNIVMGIKRRISYGILLRHDTYNIEVINNYVSGCNYGILVNGNIYNISHNVIDNNGCGISVASGDYPQSISNNIVTNCEGTGIGIGSYTSFCIVTNNIIDRANKGITVEHGTSNKIIRNIIKNTVIGVEVWGTYNEIISNNFIKIIRNARFFDHFNRWELNYWGRPRNLPKIIFGRVGEFHKTLPWINIDFTPAKEPYDIEVLI